MLAEIKFLVLWRSAVTQNFSCTCRENEEKINLYCGYLDFRVALLLYFWSCLEGEGYASCSQEAVT